MSYSFIEITKYVGVRYSYHSITTARIMTLNNRCAAGCGVKACLCLHASFATAAAPAVLNARMSLHAVATPSRKHSTPYPKLNH